jgi:hypothetical protein
MDRPAFATVAPRCLYLVRARFADPARRADWDAWYEREHIPQLLSVPGIRSVCRYQDADDPEWFVAAYEIDSPAVFEHPRYAEVRGWGPWAATITEWGRSVLELLPTGSAVAP